MSNFRTHQEITWAEGHDPVPRHVVCAANKYGDVIICGARHHDKVMKSQIIAIGKGSHKAGYKFLRTNPVEGERTEQQGFIDQYGIWMSREEAAFIVVANKQHLRDVRFTSKGLFSENLY